MAIMLTLDADDDNGDCSQQGMAAPRTLPAVKKGLILLQIIQYVMEGARLLPQRPLFG